ncbi:MAG: hypothetical protein KA144_14405 [Xanthomonadaceae bacterium]|nr:hypothetical protein [Xanthomonadaceae bacterium]
MKNISMKLTLAAFALLFAAEASAQALQVQRPVPYSEDGDIADNIKQECKIDEQLADFIQEYAKKNGTEVTFVSGPVDTAAGRVLDVRITNAISMGNAFMGHQKGTTVAGTLYENGQKIASFKARRHSMGGAFAGYKGSCSVLGRTVKTIGEDIAGWLKAPTDGAKLGDH